MTDIEFVKELNESFYAEDIVDAEVPDDVMYRVKSRLDGEIRDGNSRRYTSFFMKAASCAAVLFAVLATVYTAKWHETENLLMENIVTVQTSVGEKVTVTLPDGTVVCLNSDSKLVYAPGQFCYEERRITFSGEGYFSVAKDVEHPFIISSDRLNVKVLGTKFNLLARSDRKYSELSLEEGSVLFTSTLYGKSVVLKSHQKVSMDMVTGEVRLFNMAEDSRVAPWRNNEMVFRNVALSVVLSDLEDSYNVRIVCDEQVDTSMKFTGTLFMDDLNGVLSTLEKTCSLKASLLHGNIMIRMDL